MSIIVCAYAEQMHTAKVQHNSEISAISTDFYYSPLYHYGINNA